MANSADPRKEADKLYTDRQSQQWRQPLTANRNATAGRLGRLSTEDAVIADPRNGIGAVRVGDRTPEQAYKAAKQDGRSDRNDGLISAKELKAELERARAKREGKRTDRTDSSGYRQDFDVDSADCWEQPGGWVYAHSDGVLLKWRRKDAPREILAKLQA